MKEIIDWVAIFNNVVAALIFGIVSFLIVYLFKNQLNKRIRVFLINSFKNIVREKNYDKVDLESTLNEVTSSIENTKFFFLRIGNFTMGNPKYDNVITKVIREPSIWDYHIHLSGDMSRTKKFLNDFFVVSKGKIQSVKKITTTELSEIKRGVFLATISEIFEEYSIDQSFIEIIVQGVLQRTEKYPKLGQIDLDKLAMSNTTIFYPNYSIKLSENIESEFSKKIIRKVNNLIVESLYIGEKPLDENDSNALKFAEGIWKEN